MSKTLSLHHIVFCTKRREASIPSSDKRELFAYIYGIIQAKGCNLLRINGMEDHLHLLVDLNPTISIADFVKSIKQSSSFWMQTSSKFPYFKGWGKGYYAFSLSPSDVAACKEYIRNQEDHHVAHALIDEVRSLALMHGVDWFAQDWE